MKKEKERKIIIDHLKKFMIRKNVVKIEKIKQ